MPRFLEHPSEKPTAEGKTFIRAIRRAYGQDATRPDTYDPAKIAAAPHQHQLEQMLQKARLDGDDFLPFPTVEFLYTPTKKDLRAKGDRR
ncbi:MAG: hypothetical protein HYT10_00210 [Candidatus Levybacteria bacterium]|nr:hypothetical protein [Candidatus Levybacteria bacterium]